MLRKLNPDELDDIGDFILAICKLAEKHHKKQIDPEDISYSLIFTGMSLGLESSLTPQEIQDMCDFIFEELMSKKRPCE